MKQKRLFLNVLYVTVLSFIEFYMNTCIFLHLFQELGVFHVFAFFTSKTPIS